MNETKNILLKLFILLTCAVGWSSGAWAQSFPVAGKVYTIKAKFSNANDDSYLSYNGTQLMFEQNPVNNDSYWTAELSGASDFVWRFKSVRDETKYLDANSTSGLAGAGSIYANFNVINCGSVSGLFHLNGRIGNGDTRNNLNIGTWGYTNANTGFGRRGNGAWGTGESNTNWTTNYEIVENILLGDNVTIKYLDANGNDLSDGAVNYTKNDGSVVKISTATFDFGNTYCPLTAFAAVTNDMRIAVNYNEGTQTLSFTITPDPNYIRFSDAPTATEWAVNTHWFTMRNNRTSYSGGDAARWNRKYLTVTENGVRDDFSMTIENTPSNVAPTDRGGYWCFVGDADAFKIQNAAYGPDFYLAYLGNNKYAMVHKDYIPSGAVYEYTYNDQSNIKDGASIAYIFRIGTSGWNHIHCNNNNLIAWAPDSWQVNDTGSAFLLTLTDNAVVDAMPDYDVYKLDVTAGATVSYQGSRSVFGKRGSQPSQFFILAKGSPEVTQADIQSARDIESFSLSTPSDTYIKNITVTLSLPKIVHRRAYFYDKYDAVAEANRPRNSSYVGRDGDGWMKNDNTNDDIQKTSEYRIPVYLEPGTSRQMYMPTDKLAYYQRWYDYKTEGLVNTGVMPELYSSNFKTYANGHVSGKVASGIAGWQQNPTFYLPKNAGLATDVNGIYEDYIVAVDVSRYKDNSTDNVTGNLTEPTLSQRVLFEIKDANKIAQELVTCSGTKWFESRSIIFPTIKRGTTTRNTAKDALPIDMDLNNYWVYNSSHKLVQLTNANQIVVEVDDNTAGITASLMPSIGNNVGWGGVNFSQSHFISFEYPGSGTVRTVPDNSHATVKVYFVEGGNRYQLAKFELTFAPGTDPKIITEVIGKKDNGEYKSERSPYSLEEKYGKPVAELTFDNKNILMKDNLPAGGVDGAGGTDIGTYLFPLDFSMTNYAYGYEKGDGTARGEYTIANARHIPGGSNANFRFKPVQYYYDVLNGTTNEHNNDQFYIYVDASDQPGEVMSLSIRDNLCAGTRLYVSGWMSTTSNNSNPASVILNLVAKKSGTGESKILTSYCPGMLHTFMYDENGNEVAKMNNTTGEATSGIEVNTQYWGLWSQISFSFLLTSADVNDYDEFQLQVLNNCYNSSGGDYLLDNFQIFANPPRAEVDFTTPLCSDKVRHVKVHTDFNMLKNLSNVNENDPDAKLYATFCFVNSKKFDEYQGSYTHPMSHYFTADERGNHVLNSNAYNGSEVKPEVLSQIDEAFGAALVGNRTTDKTDDAHGFHVIQIPAIYSKIDPYAYNDSEDDTPYREAVNGVDRVVFKEPVVRAGEDDGKHLHSSTEYYIVFAGNEVTTAQINAHNTATNLFGIQTVCSFFGKFTTKDPLHIILDNADIEADLPIRAVCHGETVDFSFDMPARKFDGNTPRYPIVDEEYCTSDNDLNGKIVPSTNGARHYRFEPLFTTEAVYGVIKNMPYDWWLGGTLNGTTYRGTIDAYYNATHPTIKYDQPKDKANKQHGDPVNIAQAMTDFRFFYPDVDESTLSTVTVKDYNPETGYGLLQSEINTIKDFVDKGIILLHRTQYTMSLTAEKSVDLTNDELSKMTSNELNSQILALALELNKNVSWGEDKKPLKALESKVLSMISDAGKKQLTFEEFSNFTYAQLQGLADLLSVDRNLSEGELRKAVEAQLRAKTDAQLLAFAEANFPDVGHEKRAYLVIRALNIMNDETLKNDIPEEKKQDAEYIRSVLRDKMITIFSDQDLAVLKKMWNDVSAKLTPEESAELLNGNDPETMNETQLATIVEKSLGKITDRIIGELKADKYIHFTLVPIMPSQESFVDEQYLFCPEPRGVKVRITSHEPKMLDGFADMPYPEDMENVPVRLGLKQISESKASAAKTLRIPVRGLKQAAKDGVKAVRVADTGYGNYLFLVETNDPAYKQNGASAGGDGLTEAVNDDGTYKRMVGKVVEEMAATYPTKGNLNPDNYLTVKFEDDMNFREGYTYRVGLNFMEYDSEDHPTISCYGTMLLDMKIVPEYQKWTASVNSDWTDDQNWARADRDELNADNAATGSVIAGSTDITVAANYPTNEANKKSSSFVPMYFTNVLVDGDADAPVLYTVTAASRGEKKFLQGLTSNDATQAQHIYDMEVAPSTGAWHDDNNYECTLFGTYVANGITFKPGSQLINAQHLTYNKAWVEYELQAGRWYTLSSPLQNTFAGEWYSPTDGGKQLTPHFYDITYQQGQGSQNLNDRFRPAYYQRSWDNGGNNVVFTKSNTDSDNYAYYIAADWSYVYNDVKKEYSNGAFSVLAETGFMGNGDAPADGKVLVRLPKADTGYTYFDVNSETGQKEADVLPIYTKNEDGSITLNQDANPSKLFTDKLKNASSFTQTITNETEGNNFFLVANPFMANMDMDEFFAANSEKIEPKFWIMTANGQEVSVRTETGWVSTSDQVAALGKSAPLQGFFVKGKTNSKSVEITYTAAMQAESTATAPLQARPMATSNNQTLTINAQYGDITSTAIVAINGGASTDFVSTEDCETFIDSNIADLPTIYTVASGQAMTVNSVPAIDMLPLGIVSETDDNVEVSFSGFEGTLYLYDAQLKTTQTLTEGMTVAMPTNTSGRYFITVDPSTTGITTTTAETSSRKGVWTLSGKYCGTAVKNLAPGVYVVDGVKMVVR